METAKVLQNLLNGTASENEIAVLKQLLASGEISIGGNVNHSVIIIGSGNSVDLTPEALERLNARPLLGGLERDLTANEIMLGLTRLETELPMRAPILLVPFREQARRLRSFLNTSKIALTEQARKELVESTALINGICAEALDISFNALCTGEVLPEYDSRSPFRGLESFRPEDREFFFGRENLTKKLVTKIKTYPFLAVLGASGSGKSSLVMAGLIPALKTEYVMLQPGSNPLEALSSADESDLTVVDQFEELFTLTVDDRIRKEYIHKLLQRSRKGIVVITLRSDFLAEVASYPDLNAEVQDHLENVPPMDIDELRRAMEQQANQVGLRFEADLSQQILDDVDGEPGAMPLLQHALWELWNRRHGRYLRAYEYRAFGGVKYGITFTAEKVYGECTNLEQEQIRNIFLRLTRLDHSPEGRDTRRRVLLQDLIEIDRAPRSTVFIVRKLADARLVVLNGDDVEVTHEALIRNWTRLRGWLDEDRANLQLRERVSESAHHWEKSNRDVMLLNHRGGSLDDAARLSKDQRYKLTDLEQEYITQCINYQNRRKRLERRITLVSGLIAIIMLVTAVVAGQQWRRAERQSELALARQIAAESRLALGTSSYQTTESLLLALESMKLFPTLEGYIASQDALKLSPELIGYRSHKDFIVWFALFSPDGNLVLSKSDPNTLTLWNYKDNREIARISTYEISAAAFSPDGKKVGVVYANGGAGFWYPYDNKFTEIQDNNASGVASIKFSYDSKYLLVLYKNGEAVLLNLFSNVPSKTFSVSGVSNIEFFMNENLFATVNKDGTINVWDFGSGNPEEIHSFKNTSKITAAKATNNGKYIITEHDDNTLRVWDLFTGKDLYSLHHDGQIFNFAISPDSKLVASTSKDQTARVWDLSSGQLVRLFRVDMWARLVEFSPDSRTILVTEGPVSVVSIPPDVVHVWDVQTGLELARFAGIGWITDAHFDRTGNQVLIADNSFHGMGPGRVGVWNTKAESNTLVIRDNPDNAIISNLGEWAFINEELWKLGKTPKIQYELHTGRPDAVAFSPDDTLIAYSECAGTNSCSTDVRVFITETGKQILEYSLGSEKITDITFSSNNRWLVLSNPEEYIVHIVDVRSGEINIMDISQYRLDLYDYALREDLLAIDTADGGVKIIDLKNRKILRDFSGLGYDVRDLSLNQNLELLAVGGYGGHAEVFNINTGQKVFQFHDKNLIAVNYIAFSNSPILIFASEKDTVSFWDIDRNQEIWKITSPSFISSHFELSPNKKLFATADVCTMTQLCNANIHVWDTKTGAEVARMTHSSDILDFAFSENGEKVVSKSYTGLISSWYLLPRNIIEAGCRAAGRNFTNEEWLHYFPDDSFRVTCSQWALETEYPAGQ